MTIQDFLKTLKTAKRPSPSSSGSASTTLSSSLSDGAKETLFTTLNKSAHTKNPSPSSFLSFLSSHKLQSFLSDPNVRTFDCFLAFNFLLRNQSELSFKPDLHAHLTLVCRLIKSRKFSDAEILLSNVAFHRIYRYPFSDFVRWIENYCNESRIITKLLNMLLKVYSDHRMFDMALTVFEYMVEWGFERDERTCSIHLLAMTHSGRADLAFSFFHRMVDSGMEVSVYSLTIVVSGLCNVGELKMARELVETEGKRFKPNIITFNTLVDACARRRDILELDLVLLLMKQERIPYNDTTFKLLIECYSGSNKTEEAEKLLSEMHDKSLEVEIYLYYTIISGYCRQGNITSALSLFTKMQEMKLSPSVDVYWCLISGLCRVGEMGHVKKLVQEMQSQGGELDDVLLNALVNGYDKAGMVDELAGIQQMIESKCSSMIASSENSMDSESKIELVMDDESLHAKLDNLQ